MGERTMLNRWAAVSRWITEFEDILQRLEADKHIDWISTARMHDVLCNYYGVDQNQLERERRALLDEQRELNRRRHEEVND